MMITAASAEEKVDSLEKDCSLRCRTGLLEFRNAEPRSLAPPLRRRLALPAPSGAAQRRCPAGRRAARSAPPPPAPLATAIPKAARPRARGEAV
eukprot:6855713-Alexandrium_andersonii.AAC.1